MGKKIIFKYKSLSYLLLAFLGALGAHRLYLRRIKSGLALAGYSIASVFFEVMLPAIFPDMSYKALDMISVLLAAPVWVILIYDLFNIHKWANQINWKHNPDMVLNRSA
jgi:hypothetical protein